VFYARVEALVTMCIETTRWPRPVGKGRVSFAHSHLECLLERFFLRFIFSTPVTVR
jgi:hypothetical protein